MTEIQTFCDGCREMVIAKYIMILDSGAMSVECHAGHLFIINYKKERKSK